MKPPISIDNADTLFWAWSERRPFGRVPVSDAEVEDDIHGLAICQYKGTDEYCRFSCNRKWEVVQDCVYRTIKQAMELLPEQYKYIQIKWIKYM